MQKKTRTVRRVLALFLLVALLLSVAYIVVAAEHDCVGENCATCRQVEQCEHFLRLLLCTSVAVGGTAGVFRLALLRRRHDEGYAEVFSPVTYKVKLSD